MNPNDPDNPTDVSESTERLICRVLDGEASGGQRAELDALLGQDASARRLFDAYRRTDALCQNALRRAFDRAAPRVAVRRDRGYRLAVAGALLAAAAVVGASFLPNLWTTATPAWRSFATSNARKRPVPAVTPVAPPATFVDYRDADYYPLRQQRDVVRDLVGLRTRDHRDREVIMIFERNAEATHVIPITGEF
jgi:hypothetical protein